MHCKIVFAPVVFFAFYFGATTQIKEISETHFSDRAFGEENAAFCFSFPGENWLISPPDENIPFSMDNSVKGIGFVLTIDEESVTFEDRFRGVKGVFSRQVGAGIVFLPPVVPDIAERFCRSVQLVKGNEDHIWLVNGDEISGALVRMDSRRLLIRTFDVDLIVPRYKVRAICFGTNGSP